MTAPLLTVEEVAGLLSVRPALVRTMAHRGEIPYLRVGRKLMRFRAQDLDGYVSNHLLPGRASRERGRGVA